MVEERRYRFKRLRTLARGPQDRFAGPASRRCGVARGRTSAMTAIGGAGTALADQTAQGTATRPRPPGCPSRSPASRS